MQLPGQGGAKKKVLWDMVRSAYRKNAGETDPERLAQHKDACAPHPPARSCQFKEDCTSRRSQCVCMRAGQCKACATTCSSRRNAWQRCAAHALRQSARVLSEPSLTRPPAAAQEQAGVGSAKPDA